MVCSLDTDAQQDDDKGVARFPLKPAIGWKQVPAGCTRLLLMEPIGSLPRDRAASNILMRNPASLRYDVGRDRQGDYPVQ
jgi:hypothetical protein